MKIKIKSQLMVMLILSFILLNVEFMNMDDVSNTYVITTYANSFQKANLDVLSIDTVSEVKTGLVAKDEASKKKAEEEKQKAMEAAKNSYVSYYREDDVGTATNLELASEIITYAKQFVGNPYVYGGNSLTNGTDCSGFTSLIFANYGISLPRTANSQAYVGKYVNPNNRQIGDLVLYGYDGYVSHAAIYIGDNQVVHALNSNVGIVITDYNIMPVITVRRVL